ncbi:hypothetical protein SH668x_002938 [Planctomicrobium sp. SH668]|uniref:hypothetical protein n=1 Tax=Planctomicrobium sp. SH668 TaxID=3448126 RepID=UPI003F5B33C8
MKIALAVGCATGIQFSGCVNNADRSDTASASEVAAEQASEQLSHTVSLQLPSDTASQRPMGSLEEVVFAESEFDDDDVGIILTAGEAAAKSKSSFWNLFGKKTPKSEINDPFAELSNENSDVAKKGRAAQLGFNDFEKAATPTQKPEWVAQQEPAPVQHSRDEEFNPDRWFEKEAKRTENQTAVAEVKQPVPESEIVFKESAQTQQGVWTEVPGERATQQVKAESVAPKVDTTPKWAEEDTTSSRRLKSSQVNPSTAALIAAKESAIAEKAGTSAPPTTARPDDLIIHRQQKLKVQALMSEAQTSKLRGELHAAYRSALLADKVSQQYQLKYNADEVVPAEFAEEIAAKLYPQADVPAQAQAKSNEMHLKGLPATHLTPAFSTEKPIESHEQIAVDNTVFPEIPSATWKALPVEPSGKTEGALARNERMSNSHSASQQNDLWSAERLPEIRPTPSPRARAQPLVQPSGVKEESETQQKSPQQTVSVGSSAPMSDSVVIQTTPASELNVRNQPTTVSSKLDERVQFAIGHTVTEETSQPVLVSLPDAEKDEMAFLGLPAPEMERSEFPALAEIPSSKSRPALMAPPVPEDHQSLTTSSAQQAPITWNDLVTKPNQTETANLDQDFFWRLTWVMLGLLGAAVATVIGLKVSRKKQELEQANVGPVMMTAPERPVAENMDSSSEPQASSDELEIQPLRFKRAA